jgi:hypothetical protein
MDKNTNTNKREIILKNKIMHFAFQLTKKKSDEIITTRETATSAAAG